MRFFIIDDDITIRTMLSHIIEEAELGQIVGEAADGAEVNAELLDMKRVDILLIDLLMPIRDGIETVKEIQPNFKGSVVMISQVESKDLIGQAYSYGIDYYITKPLNKIEVVSVLRKMIDHIRLEKSIQGIQRSLQNVMSTTMPNPALQQERSFSACGRFILSELGIAGENGSKDLMEIMHFFYECEQEHKLNNGFPSLKETYKRVALKKLGADTSEAEIQREVKASEQRIRRTVYHSLAVLASLGLTDFAHPKFENYSSKFFDYTTVHQKMEELKSKKTTMTKPIRINTKKFIQALYIEIQHLMESDSHY